MTNCIRASLQTALNAIAPAHGNRQRLIIKIFLLHEENNASVATKPTDQMTDCTRASLQTALNAI